MREARASQDGMLEKDGRVRSRIVVGRLVAYGALVSTLALVLSGCVAIKSESSSTRAPGVVTIALSLCASHRVAGSNCIPSPATSGLTANTAEGDNGQDALTSSDPTNPLKGQLVVGFRLPTGTVAPDQFTSATGEQFNKNQGYTDALTTTMPPGTGFRWVGYLSSAVTLTGGASLTSLNVEFGLPAAADGSPFTGPFLWRAIVGLGGVGFDPGACAAGSSCFDSPQPANLGTHLQQNISDFRVMPGTGGTPVAPGEATTVAFQVRYIDNASPKFGARTFGLSSTSTLPGSPAVTPSSASLTNVTDGQTRAVTARVTVPPGTPPGTYPVTLKATDSASGVARTNTATVTVVDRTAPTITIGSPTDGVVFTQHQQITASYSCADETNGSGIASCAGPVADGAAIDTSTPGTFNFTVTGTDKAGNTASLTRTYTVSAPPPVVVAAAPPGRVNVTLAFLYPSAAATTKFTLLQVKGVPSGSTVVATCTGGGCPSKKVKGKKRPVVFTKSKASGTVNLTPFRGRALRPGATLTVTVTKPGSFGMVKKLTVKKNKKPVLTTTCLQPNSTTAKASCVN